MKKTRNLFVVTGSTDGVKKVLKELQFKGLIVHPPDESLLPAHIEEAFRQNRSIACSERSICTPIPEDAVIITAVDTTISGTSDILPNLKVIYSGNNSIAEQFNKIAEVNHFDIGDHKSNSSGISGEPTTDDCAYCRYLKGNTSKNERTVYESDNFFVMPTVGQFRTGYLLIIPKKHVMSNAELSLDVLKEFINVLSDVEFILRSIYKNNVLVWENGSGKSGVGKAKDSIVHSHVHICPSNLTSIDVEDQSRFPFEDVTMETLHYHQNHSYLLIRTIDKSEWRISDSSKLYVPRQYVRQLIAEECGYTGEEYNWRTHPYRELMYETRTDIAKFIETNFDALPDRIRRNTSCLIK